MSVLSKKEQVWRYISDSTLQGRNSFNQFKISEDLKISIGQVYKSLKPLREAGAVSIGGKQFQILDIKKVLTIWAVNRRLSSDRLPVSFAFDENPSKMISHMPGALMLTSYAGYIKRYSDAPAPLEIIRAYVRPHHEKEVLKDLESRFRPVKKNLKLGNVFVHVADENFPKGSVASPSQIYVDLFNETGMFQTDYVRNLERRLKI